MKITAETTMEIMTTPAVAMTETTETMAVPATVTATTAIRAMEAATPAVPDLAPVMVEKTLEITTTPAVTMTAITETMAVPETVTATTAIRAMAAATPAVPDLAPVMAEKTMEITTTPAVAMTAITETMAAVM